MFTVDIDTSELESGWRDALEEISKGCRTAVLAASTEGAAEAIAVHSHKDQTGALTKSIRGKLTRSGRGYADGYIVAGDPKASWIDGGTAPHEIRPKADHGIGPLRKGQSRRAEDDVGTHRSTLRWRGPDGKIHFAKVVHHPGGRAFPFMGPAYLKAQRVLVRELEVALERARRIMED